MIRLRIQIRNEYRPYLAIFKKIVQNLALSILEEALFPWPLNFYLTFLAFIFNFLLGQSGAAKAKSCGSCSSGSTTLTKLSH